MIPQLSNLAFVKTHKTESTTLSSLFYRYGVRHGLTVRRANYSSPAGADVMSDQSYGRRGKPTFSAEA